MIQILLSRFRQGFRTNQFPKVVPQLEPPFRGRPELKAGLCPKSCQACVESCPSQAISPIEDKSNFQPSFDLGRCLFCNLCSEACPEKRISHSTDYRLAVNQRQQLQLNPGQEYPSAHALEEKILRIFGRSLRLRVVSAGGCNGCEVEVNVLQTLVWDIGRFGIQYVASPRHADGLVVCGPVTQNMQQALLKTYEAIPNPKLVIAIGACAISGGPYRNQDQQLGGAESQLPIDLFIPGCPPHPLTILDGLLRLLGKIENKGSDNAVGT